MSEFVSNPLFGLALSILAYLVGMLIYRRFPHPLTTPLLLSAVFIIIFLKVTGISYQDYYQGGVYLNNLIVPSTVALGIPLYKSFHLMKHHARSILFGSLLAVVVNTSFTALVAKIFGMDFFLAISLFPKSVTTAMAVGITEKLQGLTTVTLVVVVATGILTSVIGPTLLKWLKIDDPVAVGLSPWRNRPRSWNGNSLSIRFCSRSHGWLGYRCHRYSLCLCQPYRSQFDIELKSKEPEFLAF